jgi:hypothetical protein
LLILISRGIKREKGGKGEGACPRMADDEWRTEGKCPDSGVAYNRDGVYNYSLVYYYVARCKRLANTLEMGVRSNMSYLSVWEGSRMDIGCS